jgi:hypothetical protein
VQGPHQGHHAAAILLAQQEHCNMIGLTKSLALASLVACTATVTGASFFQSDSRPDSTDALAFSPATMAPAPMPPAKPKISTPTITCAPNGTDGAHVLDVTICAGATGLPAGFSIQMETCDELAAGPDGLLGTLDDNTWFGSDDPRLCKASFSGNANGTIYNLAAGQCLTVYAGAFELNNPQGYSASCTDPLECGTCYVFRAFGHATSSQLRSDYSANTSCTTASCGATGYSGCTKSKGYFSNLGVTNGTTQCALDFLGGSFVVGTTTFTSVAQIAAALSASGPGNTQRQAIALTLNLAVSDGGCANACDAGNPYPSGLGAAVLCGIVDGVTPLTGSSTFPVGSAALLNGTSVLAVLNETNSVLNGGTPTLGLTSAQLGDLCALLNLSFDGADGTCCGASDFGLSHLCTAP